MSENFIKGLTVQEYHKNYYENNKVRFLANCEFYYLENRELIIERVKKYAGKNKEKINKYRHKYYEKNKKSILKKNKIYTKNHLKECREQKKAYYKKNKEQKKEYDKKYGQLDICKVNRKKYRQSFRGQLFSKKNQAKRRTAKYSITPEKVKRAFEKTNGVCPYCPAEITETSFSLDHIKPVSKGGTNHLNNLIGCCRSCNSRKGNLSLNEFLNNRKVLA